MVNKVFLQRTHIKFDKGRQTNFNLDVDIQDKFAHYLLLVEI